MVVVAVWGAEFIQFLGAVAIFPRTILKNRRNSLFSFKSSWYNSSSRGKELNKFCPQTKGTTFAFSPVFILLLCLTSSEIQSWAKIFLLAFYCTYYYFITAILLHHYFSITTTLLLFHYYILLVNYYSITA